MTGFIGGAIDFAKRGPFLDSLASIGERNFAREKNPRLLEERSHLTVEFPQSKNRVFRTYIPFLENPKITESGSNFLQEYNIMGRAGSIYSYGGSESRAIGVTFNISLLHLLHLDSTEGLADKFTRHFNLFFSDKESSKAAFELREQASDEAKDVADNTGDAADSADDSAGAMTETESKIKEDNTADLRVGRGYPHAQIHRNFYRHMVKQITGSDPGFAPSKNMKNINKLTDLVYVWVNLIRGTCLNNARNTVQGPPIVRLTHGAMYNNVPCVVNDYDIRILDAAGFDVETLTPKRIEVTLTLSELRTGNFGSFKAGHLETGDNLAGWEAIIEDNNIDPYNGDITLDGVQVFDMDEAGEESLDGEL